MRDLLTVLGIETRDRGRPQPRRRGGDAVRLPVPGAHRADGAGGPGRHRPRRDDGGPGGDAAAVPAAHGRGDAAGRSGTSARRRCAALSRTGIARVRDLDEVAYIYESFRDPARPGRDRHVVRACVDWKGQIITMADRAYLTAAMPMCVIWGKDDAVIPVSHAEIAREHRARRRHRGRRERRPLRAQGPPGAVRQAAQRLRAHDRAGLARPVRLARDAHQRPESPAVRERAGQRPLRPVARLSRRRTSSA